MHCCFIKFISSSLFVSLIYKLYKLLIVNIIIYTALTIVSEVKMATSKVVAILGELMMIVMMDDSYDDDDNTHDDYDDDDDDNHDDDNDDNHNDDNVNDDDDMKVGRARRASLGLKEPCKKVTM